MNKISEFLRESSVARFLIPTGLILIIAGIIFFIASSKNQNYIKIEAIVTKTEILEDAHTDADGNHVDATYKAYIKYTVDEKEYENTLENVSKFKEEEKITIYYNPDDPTKITQTKSLIIPIIIIVAGIASLIGGVISAINAYKKHQKMKAQEKEWSNAN